MRRDGEGSIVDAQVGGMSASFEEYHANKVAKHSDPDLLSSALGGHKVSPIVTSATVSYRGVWSESSARDLLNLGLTKQDLKILAVHCLHGGLLCFRIHARMTTSFGRWRARQYGRTGVT